MPTWPASTSTSRRPSAARRRCRPGSAELGLGAPGPWRRGDVVAAVSTVRALFGAGGGSELNDAAVMAGSSATWGAKLGRQVYEDFRNRDNRDGPQHTTKRLPLPQGAEEGRLVAAPRRTRPRGVTGERRQARRGAGRPRGVIAHQVRAAEALDAARRRRPLHRTAGCPTTWSSAAAADQERVSAPDRRPAGRLLLAADPHGLRAALAHDRRARRRLPRPVDARRSWAAPSATPGRPPPAAPT